MNHSVKPGRVFVAMSGGVDSSVSAMLLKEYGHQVTGLHMLLRHGSDLSEATMKNAADARKMAALLEIDFVELDLSSPFEEKVINYFTSEYLKGRTPNPCAVCNREIKFGALLEYAKAQGAQYLATGHYVESQREEDGKFIRLIKAADAYKDQSYFLSFLTREQLDCALFPLGGLTKTKVKELARVNSLPAAERKESQDLCFMDYDNYADFIEERLERDKAIEGVITDEQGRTLGAHKGLYRYTVGQRKGLDIAGPHPLYVLRLDPELNRVVVGTQENTYHERMLVKNINWISYERPAAEEELLVKIRYRTRAFPGRVIMQGSEAAEVVFNKPVRAITPGQAAVFYRDREVLGGGWIEG